MIKWKIKGNMFDFFFKLCGKKFFCGNYFCEKICYKESCGFCLRFGDRICSCGKISKLYNN